MGMKSLNTGKLGERGVVRALHRLGYDGAERRKAGRLYDALDITVAPGIVASVKAGEAAKNASISLIGQWREEAEQKRLAEGADICLLIVHRRGTSPDKAEMWRTWVLGTGREAWETTLDEATRHIAEVPA